MVGVQMGRALLAQSPNDGATTRPTASGRPISPAAAFVGVSRSPACFRAILICRWDEMMPPRNDDRRAGPALTTSSNSEAATSVVSPPSPNTCRSNNLLTVRYGRWHKGGLRHGVAPGSTGVTVLSFRHAPLSGNRLGVPDRACLDSYGSKHVGVPCESQRAGDARAREQPTAHADTRCRCRSSRKVNLP